MTLLPSELLTTPSRNRNHVPGKCDTSGFWIKNHNASLYSTTNRVRKILAIIPPSIIRAPFIYMSAYITCTIPFHQHTYHVLINQVHGEGVLNYLEMPIYDDCLFLVLKPVHLIHWPNLLCQLLWNPNWQMGHIFGSHPWSHQAQPRMSHQMSHLMSHLDQLESQLKIPLSFSYHSHTIEESHPQMVPTHYLATT